MTIGPQIEWQWPLSGAHSNMRVKSTQAGGVRGARPLPFTISTIAYKVVRHAPAERADTLLLYLLYTYMCSVSISVIKQS